MSVTGLHASRIAPRLILCLLVRSAHELGVPGYRTAWPRARTRSPARTSCRAIRPATGRSSGAGDPTIQGFATSMSVNVGQTIRSRSRRRRPRYHIDILRLGYYQGNGARKIAAEHAADAPRSADPAGLPDDAAHRADRLRQLGACRRRGRCPRPRSRASTSPTSCATTPAATARSCSSSATTRATPTSSSDLRRDLAGLQHLRRQQPLHLHGRLPARATRTRTRAPSRSPTTGPSTAR